jgi:hypothetical protein
MTTTHQIQIEERVLSWPDVTAHAHRFGGTEYRLGKREIGHYHAGMEVVDIPFPKKVRDEVIAGGLAEPHHVLPGSGWVSKWLRDPGDVEQAVELLERSFELARAQAERRAQRVPVS